jgi:ATP-dependent Zn protease
VIEDNPNQGLAKLEELVNEAEELLRGAARDRQKEVQREKVAYHEAGHAVMLEFVGIEFARVTINPEVIADVGHGYLVCAGHVAFTNTLARSKEE